MEYDPTCLRPAAAPAPCGDPGIRINPSDLDGISCGPRDAGQHHFAPLRPSHAPRPAGGPACSATISTVTSWTTLARSPLKCMGKPQGSVEKPPEHRSLRRHSPVPKQIVTVGIIKETTLFGRNLKNTPTYKADPLGVERGGILRTSPWGPHRPQTPGHPYSPLGHVEILI